MIKDYTISKKINDKYVTMLSIKDGWKFSFHPAFKQELKSWLNGSEEYWNGQIKEWEPKNAQPTSHDTAKQDGYQAAQDVLTTDEVPF